MSGEFMRSSRSGARIAPVLALVLATVAAALASPLARAHSTGTSELRVDASDAGAALRLQWEIAVADLAGQLDLDADVDGNVDWREIEAGRNAIERLIVRELDVARGGSRCRLTPRGIRESGRFLHPHLAIDLSADCSRAGPLGIASRLYFGNPGHQTLLEVTLPARRHSGVLSPQGPRWDEPAAPSIGATLARFVGEGVWHVLIGYDHIAFLLLLLLPSVLRRAREGWEAATSARAIAGDLVRVVTAFTLAHSITLGLAATGTVEVPSRPVEIVIAASIVIAGLMNLFPAAADWRLGLAFGFGLVHGFGFANALAEIGAEGFGLVPMLAGFNIGVELAQLLIVAVALPALLRLRRSPLYARRLMPALSLATALTGAVWLAERV